VTLHRAENVDKREFLECITLRTETEWQELVDLGWNTLAPLDNAKALKDLIENLSVPKSSANSSVNSKEPTPYGNGKARFNIVKAMREFLA
jgi:UDP-N-acetylglucosamine 2-epimerase